MDDRTRRLQKLVGLKTEFEATELVSSTLTIYPNFKKLYISRVPYKKLLPGMVRQKKRKRLKKKPKDESQFVKETNLFRANRRAISMVRDYAHCNSFEIFVTFTVRSDRNDVVKSKGKLENFFKNKKRRYGNFEYLIVPEFHTDGKAIHFHALLKSYKGPLVKARNPHTGKLIKNNGRQVYNIGDCKLGYTYAQKIIQTPESIGKTATYLTKYITKDMPLFPGKKRYWISRGLSKPVRVDNPDPSEIPGLPIKWFKNQFGFTLFFTETE